MKQGILRYQYKLGYKEEQLEEIQEELSQRIAEPIKVKKIKQVKIVYAGK